MDILEELNKKNFRGIRDYYAKELKRLAKLRLEAINNGDKPLTEHYHAKWANAMRMHDRYYVLTDQQARGEA